MANIIVLWTAAMLSGVWGPRWMAGLLTAATLIVWVVLLPAGPWGHWTTWSQLAVLATGPWGLAMQRRRQRQELRQWQAEDHAQHGRLSEAARALLLLEQSIQGMEREVA